MACLRFRLPNLIQVYVLFALAAFLQALLLMEISREQNVLDLLLGPQHLIEYGACGDLVIIYPKPHSIYLRGTIFITRGGDCWLQDKDLLMRLLQSDNLE